MSGLAFQAFRVMPRVRDKQLKGEVYFAPISFLFVTSMTTVYCMVCCMCCCCLTFSGQVFTALLFRFMQV